MTAGLERRDEGWSAVQAADVAVNRDYGDHIRAALDLLIDKGEPFTTDDVTELAAWGAARCMWRCEPHSPNLIGSIIGTAARTHPSRNAAYNAEWKAS